MSPSQGASLSCVLAEESKEVLMKSGIAVLFKVIPVTVVALCWLSVPQPTDGAQSILKKLTTINTLNATVPSNGDVNPYGLVRIPKTVGSLQQGNYLVSNFNNVNNLQGTGTTIVEISPTGSMSLFAQINPGALPGPCPGGVGLTTALAVLRTGWVIVGSLPTTDGTAATAQAGCLIVLDSGGNVVETISDARINGPWDMVAADGNRQAALFVTNVLNGTVAAGGSVVNQGTVLRINLVVSTSKMPTVESITTIGSGFPERTDPAALVIGPTGVGLSPTCVQGEEDEDCENPLEGEGALLYVADSLNNRIAVINHPFTRHTSAATGRTLTSGGSLNDPLGLTVALNGRILVVNGDDGFVTEITPGGKQIAKELIDSSGSPPGSGALFGVFFDALHGLVFVDDATNTLNLLH
jgi:hypothetical protein